MSILLIQLATFVQHQRNARRHICMLLIAYSEHVIASFKFNEEDRNIFKKTSKCCRGHFVQILSYVGVYYSKNLFDLKNFHTTVYCCRKLQKT